MRRVIFIVMIGAMLAGCASTGARMPPSAALDPACSSLQFKHSDPRCNPAMRDAGGGL